MKSGVLLRRRDRLRQRVLQLKSQPQMHRNLDKLKVQLRTVNPLEKRTEIRKT
jgi:hypothetical protein